MEFQPPKYLPEDILILVLFRLPVKSLVRFMSVCRTWHHLIGTPSFAKTHLTYRISPSNPDKFIFYELGSRWKLLTDSQSIFDGTLEDSTLYSTKEMLKTYDTNDFLGPKTYGVCDGLLCLSDYEYRFGHRIYLWNPTCRKIKKLPKLDDSVKDEVGWTCKAFVSFGYYDDDYKVVVIAPVGSAYIVCVYGLSTNTWNFIRTNSWNFIKGTGVRYIDPSILLYDESLRRVMDSKFVGGTVYMIEHSYVRCFDLSNEIIREIAFPEEFSDYGHAFKTETYGDTIAMFGFGHWSRFVTMWILRDKSSLFIKRWENKMDNKEGGWDYNLEGFLNNGKYLVRSVHDRNSTEFFQLCDLMNFPKFPESKRVHGLPIKYGGRTHSCFVDSLFLLNEDNLDPVLVKTKSS